jgi:hypothetical protein
MPPLLAESQIRLAFSTALGFLGRLGEVHERSGSKLSPSNLSLPELEAAEPLTETWLWDDDTALIEIPL